MISSKSRKKFKLIKEPIAPDILKIQPQPIELVVDAYGSLSSFAQKLDDILMIDPDATVDNELNYDGCYYEGDTPDTRFVITYKEPLDVVFARQMAEHEDRMAKYKKWYDKNKETILKELAARANE